MIWGVSLMNLHACSCTLTSAQWTTCGIFLMSIALAMAELGSAAPTSGGLYFWTFVFSSPKWKHFLAWIVACTRSLRQMIHY